MTILCPTDMTINSFNRSWLAWTSNSPDISLSRKLSTIGAGTLRVTSQSATCLGGHIVSDNDIEFDFFISPKLFSCIVIFLFLGKKGKDSTDESSFM